VGVAIFNTDSGDELRYVDEMLSDWLRDALKEAGVSQAELARLLTEKLGRPIDRAAVNKMVLGTRRIFADELVAITQLLKADAPGSEPSTTPRLRTVRVAAHVQAGYWAENWEWSDDEQYDVAVPSDPVLDNFTLHAAETRGPSMNRRWPEKTVVVFTNVAETEESPIPGKRYVVERTRVDGKREHTVKLLHQDEKGLFWLVPESNDPLYQEPISVEEGAKNGDEVRIVGRVRFSVARE
jgi:transcriptional regulator with XRE-family HTH domain